MASAVQSVLGAVKDATDYVTGTSKDADLKRDTINHKISQPMTTDSGTKVSNTDNWLKISDGQQSGAFLLEDQIGREKIHRFDHERIPERVVHARGAAAHGYFKVYDDRASTYTSAAVLTDSSRTTPVFTRFSTVQGSRGSADSVRDVRGFAVKMYTEEGNWDIVGNNMAPFFIQDSIKFPDVIHAVKPEPHNEVPTGQSAHNNFWDFVGLQPEASHMIMWAMSDRGIPRSYRMMQGFGVNTFTLINKANERFFVKFHWIPELGVHSLVWDEALKIAGQDPDFHRKDLNEAIENGAPATWQFGIQVIPEANEHDFEFDILDATKIWPEELVPVEIIGEMVLNRTVTEYFPETEQVAFCTSHVVPGIGFSDDPLLQGRNFSYQDTQLSRLGTNWEQLPINRPVCPVMNHQRDGKSQHRINASKVNYWPNREGAGPPVPASEGGYVEYPQRVSGVKQRLRTPKFQEHYNQAQLFYNSLAPHEKAHLTSALSFELSHCDDPVVYESYSKLLNNIDFELAKEVATNVGGIVPTAPGRPNQGKSSASLSQTHFPGKPSIKSRRIAILVADGFNMPEVEAVRAAFATAGATTWIIGPRRGKIFAAKGKSTEVSKEQSIMADHHFEGQRSTLFDAFYIPSGATHAATLAQTGRAVHWIREAFGHLKAIAAVGEAVYFIREAAQLPGLSFASGNDDAVVESYGVLTTAKYSVGSEPKIVLGNGEKGLLASFTLAISKHRCWERETDGLSAKVAY